MRDRAMRAIHVNPAYRSEAFPIVETGTSGEAIKRLAIDPTRIRFSLRPTYYPACIVLEAKPPDCMDGQRVVREPGRTLTQRHVGLDSSMIADREVRQR